MNISAIKKAVRIVSYYTASPVEGKQIIKELLDPKNDILTTYLNPFVEEINLNLLSLETFNGKRDFIKFCVFEFKELPTFFDDVFELLSEGYVNKGPTGKKFTLIKSGRNLEESENYLVVSYELLDMLFTEIWLCCFKYKIDFYEVCKELQFDHKFIDTALYAYLVDKNKSKANKISGGFQTYLKRGGKKLNHHLVRMYKNGKPESIAYMLFALVELKLIDASVLSNQTKLHFMLTETFGKVGTRQNLNLNISKLRVPDDYQNSQIQVFKSEIQTVLNRL